jgi:predicted house-cleaning noncanonical NTP pyrophosphatase (MazG superfamily)
MSKLVRDRIPEIMRSEGSVFVGGKLDLTKQAEQFEYLKALRRKLIEEAVEAFHAFTENELCEELADVLEVVDALQAALPNMPVQRVKREKRMQRGGFEQAWIMR